MNRDLLGSRMPVAVSAIPLRLMVACMVGKTPRAANCRLLLKQGGRRCWLPLTFTSRRDGQLKPGQQLQLPSFFAKGNRCLKIAAALRVRQGEQTQYTDLRTAGRSR